MRAASSASTQGAALMGMCGLTPVFARMRMEARSLGAACSKSGSMSEAASARPCRALNSEALWLGVETSTRSRSGDSPACSSRGQGVHGGQPPAAQVGECSHRPLARRHDDRTHSGPVHPHQGAVACLPVGQMIEMGGREQEVIAPFMLGAAQEGLEIGRRLHAHRPAQFPRQVIHQRSETADQAFRADDGQETEGQLCWRCCFLRLGSGTEKCGHQAERHRQRRGRAAGSLLHEMGSNDGMSGRRILA